MGSFAPRGHARLDPRKPEAFAICDRCGFQYVHKDLVWDTQWRGRRIERTGYMVCPSCADTPNPTVRPIVLPADPVPILNPRREPLYYALLTADMIKYTADTNLFTADNGNF